MRALLILSMLAVVVPDREDQTPKEKAKPIQQQILCDWQLVQSVRGGRPDHQKDAMDAVLTFTAGEIQITENGKRQDRDDAVYTLDLTKKPVAIDITPKRGNERKIEGILKLEGDQLTICFTLDGPRPTEFTTRGEKVIALMQLRRIKK
ncbi:MAG: TIGR03067 domain-containing protein [Gemmataceae bacterium]|nr:TIGR03067 domain-containing protein [Gemmataceae bacterium]